MPLYACGADMVLFRMASETPWRSPKRLGSLISCIRFDWQFHWNSCNSSTLKGTNPLGSVATSFSGEIRESEQC